MKTLQKILTAIFLITLISSCGSGPDIKHIVSDPEMRKKIIDSIANNSNMSQEMMTSMLNSRNGKSAILGNEKLIETMLGNREDMMKIMEDNPALMQNLMSDMLEVSKHDSGMMSLMYETMMENQQMKEMMQKKNSGMKMMDGMSK